MPVVSKAIRKIPATAPRQQPKGPPCVSPCASGGKLLSCWMARSSSCASSVDCSSAEDCPSPCASVDCSPADACSGSCDSLFVLCVFCSSEISSGGVDTDVHPLSVHLSIHKGRVSTYLFVRVSICRGAPIRGRGAVYKPVAPLDICPQTAWVTVIVTTYQIADHPRRPGRAQYNHNR